ncbi:TRAP transporter large permease [Rhodoferax sp.]|uniref:TRAP transporter large permease n=1 Tax=Rhodoferax sp. TaxID=50421 RepID=UPI002726B449|nr:TRAP transporter large permease [Rhodoferax sp.]MDO9143794.1 TRAP transporter large permease [Rhodoferax sp.]MDP1531040.1 TRAP transporter large permease [Rhodoferax sp.]MDP1945057.1 TRAP transporter large permease [Rhodoferax sp.]MDP2442339.1 TRAP transporter large permease [Rhodoferax sp.]MDP3193069.1 TRAP transporter large permease [Rhodoferax sp.]
MTILLISFALLLVIGLPIAIAMMGASLLVILVEGIPISVVAQRVVTGVQSFPLLAIPLFTLAGSLMNDSGISERLFSFTRAFVGHIRGGMAQTAIVGNIFLSGISGSSVADCAATSRVFVPQLTKAGYGAGFAAALCAACATLGPIIPPSILMVIYAWQANISLGDLFWAGIFPGLLMALAMMLLTAYIARRRRFPKDQAFAWGRLWTEFRGAFWALLMPVLILVGFRMGVFTATEIAGVAAAYALIVGLFIYRTLRWSHLPKVLLSTAKETAVILLIVAAAAPFSWILGIEQAPQLISETLKGATDSPWVILILLNVVLLILGCFMETIAIMIILVPILIPVLNLYQIDLTHFGIILLINLTIGQLTPPVGVLLFVASSVSKVRLGLLVREVVPYVAVLILTLLVITNVPALSLWLPQALK